MSTSSAAKGKARAVEADTNQETLQFVKLQPIPSTTLLSIEYPGVLSHEVSEAGPSSSSSLERALSTLHSSALPPLTSSPQEALRFLSRIPNEGLKVLECRLGGFASPLDTTQDTLSTDVDQVYKAPLIGEAVPTHNIVIRIVKRTWRQKRKRRRSASPELDHNDTQGMALDPALFSNQRPPQAEPETENVTEDQHPEAKRGRYTGRVKKEYCVEVLGMATNTVRFRSMADFAFRPDVSTSTPATTSAEAQLDPVLALHKALATMDLAAFQNFRVPKQLEDYQVQDPASPSGAFRSNLHMVPPAFFSRMDVPFNYAFSQTPYSELRTIATPSHLTKPPTSASFAHALKRSNLPPGQMQRFVNRVRLSNISPQPFRVGRDAKVPTKPLPDVVRIEHRCDPKVLARLRELLLERPIWSRVALKNQLNDAELHELHGNNEKVYYALVAYSMVGGPWRDTIVRFGYDVRKDQSSRIYQRIFLRGAPAHREARHSTKKQRAQTQPHSRLDADAQAQDEDGDGDGEEGEQQGEEEEGGDEEEDEELGEDADEASSTTVVNNNAARSSIVPLPSLTSSTSFVASSAAKVARTDKRNTHMFDGTTLHRHVGNFQLCDIEDPLIKPYIWRANDPDLPSHSILKQTQLEPMGTPWLRDRYDPETGWYSRRALDLIRSLITARFRTLIETGKPLDEFVVDEIVAKTRQRWTEEDAGSMGGTAQSVHVGMALGEEEASARVRAQDSAQCTQHQDQTQDFDESLIDPSLV